MPNILALDIGGANIKLADGGGYAASHPFALWKSPEKLGERLSRCLADAPPTDRIIITMTGELCDCYETKAQGVKQIVAATMEAAAGKPALFYQTTGQFVSADDATQDFLLTAASNWHALTTFAARYCDNKSGMLIDIGSTTTDIIPIINGNEAAQGRSDPERLLSGELVYAGVERSPVCAIVSHLKYRGTDCPVAQEFFATSADAYLLLDELPENPENVDTADGMPFIRHASHARLARMVCGDRDLVRRDEVESFAAEIRDAQLCTLEFAWNKVFESMIAKPKTVVLSGHGAFLAHRLLQRVKFSGEITSLNEQLGPDISRCACAHALAVLASETI